MTDIQKKMEASVTKGDHHTTIMAENKNTARSKLRHEKYIKRKERNGRVYFTVQFSYTDYAGKHNYSKTFSSSDYMTEGEALAEACKHRDIKRAEMYLTGLPNQSKRTIERVYEDYCKDHPAPANTQIVHDRLANIIFKRFPDKPVEDITPSAIEAHLEAIKDQYNQQDISRIAGIWKTIFKQAIREGIINRSPIEMVNMPKSTKLVTEKKQTCSDEEVEAIISRLKKHGHDTAVHLVRILRYTGMRLSEALALEWDCVDFDQHTIQIKQRTGLDHEGRVVARNPKTRLSARIIPMSEACEEEMRSIEHRGELVLTFNGNYIPASEMTRLINNTSKSLGIDFHLYMLRHNVASKLITANVDPRTVMEILGHSTPVTTIGTYARSDDDLKRNAINLVEISRKPS